MKAHLCKCNKCGSILLDENPKEDAPELEVPSNNVREMSLLPEPPLSEINRLFFWACPVCQTDEYLTDLTTI